MQLIRPAYAAHPSRFGRGPARVHPAVADRSALLDDLRLFAATFLAGFLFVSILIG